MKTELFPILRYLGLPSPKGIIQVGASYGQELKDFIEAGVGCGILIEPLDEPFQHLASVCRQTPDFIAVKALCTEKSGQTYDFNVASNHGTSSSILTPANHLTQFDYVHFTETRQITSISLDDVFSSLRSFGYDNICGRVDTLYIDTQGAELSVLQGALDTLKSIKYIFTEVTRNNMYSGAPSLEMLVDFLHQFEFVLNNVNFNKENHADAIFLRADVIDIKL